MYINSRAVCSVGILYKTELIHLFDTDQMFCLSSFFGGKHVFLEHIQSQKQDEKHKFTTIILSSLQVDSLKEIHFTLEVYGIKYVFGTFIKSGSSAPHSHDSNPRETPPFPAFHRTPKLQGTNCCSRSSINSW